MATILTAACACNTGKIRKNNEDNFFFDGRFLDVENDGLPQVLSFRREIGKGICLAVFDGMGGENYGEFASFEAARNMCRELEKDASAAGDPKSFEALAQLLNRAVCKKASELGTDRMGSTMVAFSFFRDSVCTCNVGDSRAYRYRQKKLVQLSTDHTETPRPGRKKAPLTQHLGIDPEWFLIEPAVVKGELRPDDRYLLCSDGVTDMLSDEEIAGILEKERDVTACAQALVDAALANGGRDNITAIICAVEQSGAPQPVPARGTPAGRGSGPEKTAPAFPVKLAAGALAVLLLLILAGMAVAALRKPPADEVETEAVMPAVPTETVEPAAPAETEEPTAPTATVEPAMPAETEKPAVPTETVEPAAPVETEEPAVTVRPGTPPRPAATAAPGPKAQREDAAEGPVYRT